MTTKYRNGQTVYFFDTPEEKAQFLKEHKDSRLIPEDYAREYKQLYVMNEIRRQERTDRVIDSACNITERILDPQGISTILNALSDFRRG